MSVDTQKRPWWWPQRVDDAYLSRLRKDYPEEAHLTDGELLAHFECEDKYAHLWDHLGDAYEQFEPVADLMLKLLATMPTVPHPGGRLMKLVAHYEDGSTQTIDGDIVTAALAQAESDVE
jgi:hypothetical protein